MNSSNLDTLESRTREFSWEDPMIGASRAFTMDGIDYLREIVKGTIPPPSIGPLMDFTLKVIEHGEATFEVTPSEFHYNPIGMIHGGLFATLLDSAMGCAIQSTLKAGSGYSTVDLQVTYVKAAVVKTGRLICTGKIVHGGKKIATGYGEVRDPDGVLYAHGTTTCLILHMKS